ncbi:hypothetical protein Sme01_02800 [Sphaerisporangium melleum]|uniref:Uncharacterized protein n=1 Tax=Sphaerisporangium melleum TaxID=321316 RepID=A0A917QPU5_9ACTN|nr:hypothetical protein [Sphaerisporangium melleum]GGK61174.1 hypothetical protein GCM10007964_00340 [Sphaerisporangium melleum]GII67804.1 hypothetical protein Sme01_02800 [Sphaerisporangium melleum]
MSSYDPDRDGPYGDWLKAKGVRQMNRTHATQDQVTEGRTENGGRYKAVRDQLGHVVTQRTEPDGRERQDVTINLGGPGGDH